MAKHILTHVEIAERLYVLGYFSKSTTLQQARRCSAATLRSLVRKYQRAHGLKVDGYVGYRTANLLYRRRCGVPDQLRVEDDGVCKWPGTKIAYATRLDLPGLTRTQARLAFDTACQQWNECTNLELYRVHQVTEANIYAHSGLGEKDNLDGRGGTLAWAEMPCNVSMRSQLKLIVDAAEEWSLTMAITAFGHEMGHALGLPHLDRGNLMGPYHNPDIIKPQPGDITAMQELYGKPKGQKRRRVAVVEISGTLLINSSPYILIPKT